MLLLGAVIFVLLAVSVMAVPDIEVEVVSQNPVVIAEFNSPARYELKIQNNGNRETFEIYTLVGVEIRPVERFELPQGETILEIEAYPGQQLRKNRKGAFTFEYEIKGVQSGIYRDRLTMKLVPLGDALEISAESFSPEDSEVTVHVTNLENVSLGDLDVEFDSEFFSSSESFSLGPLEEKEITLSIDEDLSGVSAGPYIVSATLMAGDSEVEKETYVDFLEKEGLLLTEDKSGLIVRKEILSKENVGNTRAVAEIQTQRGSIARLFTTHNLEPESVEREGWTVTYTWHQEVLPGETFTVETTTNYTIPFILVLVIVLVGLFVMFYSKKDVVVKKNVSLVRTKGGEFALKVILHVKAKKNVENVELTDHLPAMTTLYDKFGKRPDHIDEHARRLSWKLGNLRRGEGRVYSYVIYSKLNVVGQFELPLARAAYTVEGKRESSESNRAYFVAEKD